MEATCLSHQWSLPNKLFEYIQAGLPVLVSDLPEMRRIVSHYGVGEVYAGGDVAELAHKIDRILFHPELREEYRRAATVAAQTLHWGEEKETLISVYQKVLLS
jgi:glycosyltransferase involved in cell wall biosynthesis